MRIYVQTPQQSQFSKDLKILIDFYTNLNLKKKSAASVLKETIHFKFSSFQYISMIKDNSMANELEQKFLKLPLMAY
jgi:hypothetical protein